MVSKARGNQDTAKREVIHNFLFYLYETLAEPMPQGRGASKRPRKEIKRDDKVLQRATGLTEKALPPATFHEYLEMLQRAHPGQSFSYRIFCSVRAQAPNHI